MPTRPAERLHHAARSSVVLHMCFETLDYIARRRRVSLRRPALDGRCDFNIDTLSDPQVRPDGRSYAWVQRNTVRMASIPAEGAKEVASGTRPRWPPDSSRLAYLNKKVHVLAHKSGGSLVPHPTPLPDNSYCWTP